MKNPFDPGYFSETELQSVGFRAIGKNVQISKACTIIGLPNIEIGNNVRIDAYCSLIAAGTGILHIGSFIHIGGYSLLSAGEGITMHDFSGLSQGVLIYSRSDDYSGKHLAGPMIPAKYTGATGGPVTLKRHVMIGAGSVVFPNVTIEEGAAVGALSLVARSLEGWGVYSGCPARKLMDRSKDLLKLETEMLRELEANGGTMQDDNARGPD